MRKKTFAKMSKKRKKAPELDITSLLDILVILLVFLLRSFNASDLEVTPVKNLSLPVSKSTEYGSHSIIVQVNRDKRIWVDNKEIGSITGTALEIPELLEALQVRKEEQTKHLENEKLKARLEKQLNILIDENLKYNTMKQVMHTAALAGFPQFKFIVKSDM